MLLPVIIAFLIVAVLIFGLMGGHGADGAGETGPLSGNFRDNEKVVAEWMEKNPCGILRIRQPLLNVTGRLTAPAKLNTFIRLYTAPNTTLDGALNVAGHCRPLMTQPIGPNGSFTLGNLPVGNYVVVVSADRFIQGQGFPIITKQNFSGYAVEQVFHGGDYLFSLASFTISPAESNSR